RRGDGAALLTEDIGPSPDELLIGLVVLVGNAGGRAGGKRMDVAVALIVSGGGEAGLEVRDVAGDLLLTNVADRAGGLRKLDLVAGGGTRIWVSIDVREEIAVASVGEARQDDLAVRRTIRRGVPQVVVRQLEPAGAGEGVVPPGAVVEVSGHRVAVFAVVGQRDAEVLLSLDEIGDAGGQQLVALLLLLLRHGLAGQAGGVLRLLDLVGLDECGCAR